MHPLFDLTGRTALITGASSGLGKRMAECLSEAGARVILCGRSESKIQTLAQSLSNALAVFMDVSDRHSVQNAIQQLDDAGERIDICIASAGIYGSTKLFEEDEDDFFLQVLRTNLAGVWYVIKAIANHMKNHHIEGSIIPISSIRGEGYPLQSSPAYSTSKAGVSHLAKTLAVELAQHNIRINCIVPGRFNTPMTANCPIPTIEPQLMQGKVAQASDLDGLTLFLSSNQASGYVTGSNFTIDGGMTQIRGIKP